MKYVLWILAGIGAVIGWKVFENLQARKQQEKGATKSGDTTPRVPGAIGNFLKMVKGTFNFGKTPVTSPGSGPFGTATGGGDVDSGAGTRVPSFLANTSPGNNEVPSGAPPGIVCGSIPPGENGIQSSTYSTSSRAVNAGMSRRKHMLMNVNPPPMVN